MSPRTARILLAVYLAAIYSTLGAVRTITNELRDRGLLRGGVVVAFTVAATLALWLIFRRRENRRPRVVVGLTLTATAYAAVVYPMTSPEEKIHFIQYGVAALLAHLAAPRAWSARRRFIAGAMFVAAAGWIDELIQGLLPSRYYDLRDVAFNAAAGVMALVAIAICSPRERTVGSDRPEEVAPDTAC